MLSVFFCCWIGVLSFLSGNCFSKPGGATIAARIMKMMRRTSSTSVKGVMLISDITASSCWAETMLMSRALRSRGSGLLRFRGRLVQVGLERGAGVVEVEHFGELVGRDDHLLVVRLDPGLEVVEENNRGDGHEQAGRRGDQRFVDTRRDDGRGRVPLEGDIVEGAHDAEHRTEQPDARCDYRDGTDDAEVALERVQVLHQRDRQR